MRITGGSLVGRQIEPPFSANTRPTRDRIRQALFNILAHHDWDSCGDVLQGTAVLDACCGTGALGFEALSYGAAQAYLFDTDRDALKIAQRNAESLGLTQRCKIMAIDLLKPPPASVPCRLVLLDPPYRQGLIPAGLLALREQGWLHPQALIAAETGKREDLSLPAGFELLFTRGYGETTLHFLSLTAPKS